MTEFDSAQKATIMSMVKHLIRAGREFVHDNDDIEISPEQIINGVAIFTAEMFLRVLAQADDDIKAFEFIDDQLDPVLDQIKENVKENWKFI